MTIERAAKVFYWGFVSSSGLLMAHWLIVSWLAAVLGQV